MNRLKLAIFGVFAASLLAIAPTAALAAHTAARTNVPARTLYGSLKIYNARVDATVSTLHGDSLVQLDKRTQYIRNSSDAGSIQKGDAVAVSTVRRHGALYATSIRYDTSPFAVGRPLWVFGNYASSNDTTLVVSHYNTTTTTFNWDSMTVFIENGQVVNGIPAFVVGERLVTKAEAFTDGSLYAMEVKIYPPAPPPLRHFDGTYVNSGTGTQIVIADHRSPNDAFNYNANTVFLQGGHVIKNPTFTVGENVSIWARHQADKSWLAKYVVLHPIKPPVSYLEKFVGSYVTNSSTQLTLQIGANTDLFNYDSSTIWIQHFHVITNPTFQVGEHIAVLAVVNPGHILDAKIVWLYPMKPAPPA